MTSKHGDRSLRSVAVVIAAAGRGERLGGSNPKALEEISGRSLLAYCLDVVAQLPDLGAVVVAAPPSHISEVTDVCSRLAAPIPTIVAGGSTRPQSVANALAELPSEIDLVLVHDAARAFTPVEQFNAVIDEVRRGAKAVIPGLAVVDTIKDIDADGRVIRTVPRDSLRRVQTPQGFDRSTLVAVHSNPRLAAATDDAGMVEADGGDVQTIPGHEDAFKVTTPFDRLVAQALVAKRDAELVRSERTSQ